mmetsp:Transcript_48578/g.153877  ORF Transcript_48578/g.153877 Transcript_48578/m.153877 type:complete len:324 (-) Transcript_48578:351-1322(-)
MGGPRARAPAARRAAARARAAARGAAHARGGAAEARRGAVQRRRVGAELGRLPRLRRLRPARDGRRREPVGPPCHRRQLPLRRHQRARRPRRLGGDARAHAERHVAVAADAAGRVRRVRRRRDGAHRRRGVQRGGARGARVGRPGARVLHVRGQGGAQVAHARRAAAAAHREARGGAGARQRAHGQDDRGGTRGGGCAARGGRTRSRTSRSRSRRNSQTLLGTGSRPANLPWLQTASLQWTDFQERRSALQVHPERGRASQMVVTANDAFTAHTSTSPLTPPVIRGSSSISRGTRRAKSVRTSSSSARFCRAASRHCRARLRR